MGWAILFVSQTAVAFFFLEEFIKLGSNACSGDKLSCKANTKKGIEQGACRFRLIWSNSSHVISVINQRSEHISYFSPLHPVQLVTNCLSFSAFHRFPNPYLIPRNVHIILHSSTFHLKGWRSASPPYSPHDDAIGWSKKKMQNTKATKKKQHIFCVSLNDMSSAVSR